MPKLQEKPSALKREHPSIQNFSFLWVIFALLDPDPDPDPATQTNADQQYTIFLFINSIDDDKHIWQE
jgi:hypothetical protein